MAKRRTRIELFSNDYSRKIHFDEECQRIQETRIESKPFSDALEALNSDRNSFLSENSAARLSSRVFSVGEMTRKLVGVAKKSRAIFREDCIHRGVNATTPSTTSTRRGLKLEREAEVARKKIDLSSERLMCEKDAVLEANRLVCKRLVMASVEYNNDWWPRRDGHCCPVYEGIKPLKMNTEAAFYDEESSLFLSTDEEAQDEPKIVETNNSLHPTLDSTSDNDFPSTPPSIDRFNVPESSKYQEEHESPVSVLDQFFVEDHVHKSSNIIFHIDGVRLKPRRLCFEERSSHKNEQDDISEYVHHVIQSSSLNWGQISTIRPLSNQLLHPSLYNEVEHRFSDSHFDTRLLFDRMNEILRQIQRSHLVLATRKSRINRRLPLEEAVANEIRRESEFYQRNERTLDQIVAKDVGDCRLWFDLALESEHDVMICVSECILEEFILDVMLYISC